MTTSFRRVFSLAFGCCVLAIHPRLAAAEVVVAAGHSVQLMTLSSIDQTCRSLGPVTINIIEQPRGGYIQVSQTKDFPNFNALNTRSRCNTLKLPATRLVYQSAGTFLGVDVVTIEAIFPEGNARRIRIPVSVRPVAPQSSRQSNTAVSAAGAIPLPGQEDKPAGRRMPKTRHAQAAVSPGHDGCRGLCGADKKPRAPEAKPAAKPAQAPAVLTPI